MSELSADNNVRVIGVDFDSYLSQWGNTCPSESFRTNLADRSADILEKLKASGVGKRPVIFVGHSLGGLIIKKMLVSAAAAAATSDADRELVANARGVCFYGTPHAGTAMANLGSAAKYLFFPTAEVRELEAGSPQLEELNSSFKVRSVFIHFYVRTNLKLYYFFFQRTGDRFPESKVKCRWRTRGGELRRVEGHAVSGA